MRYVDCWSERSNTAVRRSFYLWCYARLIFHAHRWMLYNLFLAGRYIIDDIHYLRRWGAERRRCALQSGAAAAARAGGCSHGWRDRGEMRCIIRLEAEWALTSWLLLLLLLLPVLQGGDGATDVELCSHALQQRLSSVQTRAAATSSAPFSRPRRAPWRQHGHLLLDRKSFTLST